MKTDEQSVRPTGPGPDEKGPAGVEGTPGRSTIFGRLHKWWGWVTKKDWTLLDSGHISPCLTSCFEDSDKRTWQVWQHKTTKEVKYIEL